MYVRGSVDAIFRICLYTNAQEFCLCLLWHIILEDIGDVSRMCGPGV